MSVAVFGSINMDLIVRTSRLPRPGETLAGRDFFTAPGGKGGNQAVAAARAGAVTRMVGRVGDDAFGQALRESLRAHAVDVSAVAESRGTPSGVAVIAVDEAGENQILVVAGANGAVGRDDLDHLEAVLESVAGGPDPVRVLLLQLEVPVEAVLGAARIAGRRGVRVILDPAPASPIPADLYAAVDLLTPNESEAGILAGSPVVDDVSAKRAVETLRSRGARSVVLKRGARGVLVWAEDGWGFRPAFPVAAVDTVGAGDAFNGAMAAALDAGRTMAESVRWGQAAGALSAMRTGAQPSMPDREAIVRMLAAAI